LQIYSTPTCHACQSLKEKLKSKGIEFEEIDITKLKVEEQLKLNITSVPTVFHNGERYSGIQIKELL